MIKPSYATFSEGTILKTNEAVNQYLFTEILPQCCPHTGNFKDLTEDILKSQVFFSFGPFQQGNGCYLKNNDKLIKLEESILA